MTSSGWKIISHTQHAFQKELHKHLPIFCNQAFPYMPLFSYQLNTPMCEYTWNCYKKTYLRLNNLQATKWWDVCLSVTEHQNNGCVKRVVFTDGCLAAVIYVLLPDCRCSVTSPSHSFTISSPPLVHVLVKVSIGDKTPWPEQRGEGRDLFCLHFHIAVHHQRKSVQELKQGGTWSPAPMQRL